MLTHVEFSFDYDQEYAEPMEILERWQKVIYAETECIASDIEGHVQIIQKPNLGMVARLFRRA